MFNVAGTSSPVFVHCGATSGSRFDLCWQSDAAHASKSNSLRHCAEICKKSLLLGCTMDAGRGVLL